MEAEFLRRSLLPHHARTRIGNRSLARPITPIERFEVTLFTENPHPPHGSIEHVVRISAAGNSQSSWHARKSTTSAPTPSRKKTADRFISLEGVVHEHVAGTDAQPAPLGTGVVFDDCRLEDRGRGPVEHNSLGMIVVEQTAATADRERNEVGVQPVVNNSASTWHRGIVATATVSRNLLGFAPRFKNLGHPRDMAKHIRLSQYAKNRWGPKKKNVRKGKKVKHVSTARIIEQRKQAPKSGKC